VKFRAYMIIVTLALTMVILFTCECVMDVNMCNVGMFLFTSACPV
jgi:hypothetical protein